MAKSFNELASDLKDIIIDEHSNYKGLKNVATQRYNNLKVDMNSSSHPMPHVIVRIGMSEAVFAVPHGDKINGGLGMDERYVHKWISRSNIQSELESHWRSAQLNSA